MPQIIVLDAHIWFWWITQEFQRFPKQWLNIIATALQHQAQLASVDSQFPRYEELKACLLQS